MFRDSNNWICYCMRMCFLHSTSAAPRFAVRYKSLIKKNYAYHIIKSIEEKTRKRSENNLPFLGVVVKEAATVKRRNKKYIERKM